MSGIHAVSTLEIAQLYLDVFVLRSEIQEVPDQIKYIVININCMR